MKSRLFARHIARGSMPRPTHRPPLRAVAFAVYRTASAAVLAFAARGAVLAVRPLRARFVAPMQRGKNGVLKIERLIVDDWTVEIAGEFAGKEIAGLVSRRKSRLTAVRSSPADKCTLRRRGCSWRRSYTARRRRDM